MERTIEQEGPRHTVQAEMFFPQLQVKFQVAEFIEPLRPPPKTVWEIDKAATISNAVHKSKRRAGQ
jgi:hypothetical protein